MNGWIDRAKEIGFIFQSFYLLKRLTVLENVELINCAVSDEYSFEYVERIGAIGYAVNGLREGDSFKVRIGNKHYTGVVYDINNVYGSLLERGIRR